MLVLTTFAVVWLVASPAYATEASLPMSMLTQPERLAMSVAPVTSPPPSFDTRAPLCDPRGATSFAAAPQMQELEVTLESTASPDDCATSAARGDAMRASSHRAPTPSDALGSSSDAAVLTAVPKLAALARELTPAPEESTSCARPGFRSTVDRPPRA
jgi:hypothetical protein